MRKINKKETIFVFWSVAILFVLFLILMSKILFGYNIFYFFVSHNRVCINSKGCLNDVFGMSCRIVNININFISKIILFIFIGCYFVYIYWSRKKLDNYKRFIYPVFYLLLLLIIEFGYLSFLDIDMILGTSIETLFEPNINFLNPFNIIHGIILGVLIKMGNMSDNKKLKIKHSKCYDIMTLLLIIIIVVIIQSLVFGTIKIPLVSNEYNVWC